MNAVLAVREPSPRYLATAEPDTAQRLDVLATAPGGVAKLRELIRALAVQGRLLGQSGPRPADLPPDWTWKRLGDLVASSEAGWSPSCPEQPRREGRWGILKVSAVSWGEFDAAANKELPLELQPRPQYEVQHGDFLLSRANTAELVARSVVVKNPPPRLLLSDKIIRLKLNRDVNAEYVNLVNNSSAARSHYQALASGTSASMKNVSRDVVLALPVPLPPLAEQARIVARVDELMRLCDALEEKGRLEAEQHARLLSTLLGTLTDSATPEELAAHWQRVAEHFDLLLDRPEAVDQVDSTILRLAVAGRLVPQTSSDGSDSIVPAGWSRTTIGAVATLVTDGTHKTPRYVENGVKFVSAKDVRDGRLSFTACRYITPEEHRELTRRCRPERGDILVSKSGSIGTVVRVETDEEFSLFESLALIKFDHRQVVGEFFELATQDACNALSDEQVKGVAVKHLHLNVLRKIPVLLPPLEEQHRIVARVTELRRLCADLRQRLSASQTTQSSLADALVESALT